MNPFIRPLTPADEPFLWEMLYQAIHVSEGQSAPSREVVHLPELARYVRDWARGRLRLSGQRRGNPQAGRRGLVAIVGE